MDALPTLFVDSAFRTKVEFEASLKLSPAERARAENAAASKHVSTTISEEEKASFKFGGTPARPRKNIARTLVTGATFLKPPGSCLSKVPGASVELECCEKCDLYVLDPCEQVVCYELLNCRVVIGPCIGSVTFSKCVDCTITVAARETRFADCSNCEVRLYAPTGKCVNSDSCTGMRFGAWDVAYPGLAKQWATVSPKWLEKDQRNYWDSVFEECLPRGAKPTYAKMAGVDPTGRWCQLKLAPEGLNGGSVTEVRGSQPSVEGCECPVAAQDGARFA